jgi:hypothetical protein
MPSPTPTVLARARLARAIKQHRDNDHPDVTAARRAYAAEQIAETVERVVASSPPFTRAQLEKISAILDGAPVESESVTGGASA